MLLKLLLLAALACFLCLAGLLFRFGLSEPDAVFLGLPFGIGLKYFWNEGVAVRCEIVDNLMLGTREISKKTETLLM